MLRKIMIPVMLVAVAAFCSCGTNKKLKAANAENEQLKATVSQLTSKNNDLQSKVDQLTASNKSMTDEYTQYKADCEQTKQKLAAIRSALKEQQDIMDEVVKKLEEGLADFMDKGVTMHQKDGFIYVDMEEDLMYKSGSAVMSDKGKKALASLASALNDYPKLKVYIIGNTDDVKYKKGQMDNLSLSTERANGVFRTLRDDYKVEPSRLVSAGKGKYAPVADNATPEGRAKNRRTEIILNPDLVRLWENASQN
jgi:chemotaxis protein MotB